MKDLTEQIYDELNAQVVRMLEHSLAQASRIADLERQLAEASAPVEFPADGRNDDPAEAAFWRFDARKKGYNRWKGMPQSERDAFKAEYRAAIVAPQAANTDKVRKAIPLDKFLIHRTARCFAVFSEGDDQSAPARIVFDSDSLVRYVEEICNLFSAQCDYAANRVAMTAQAPVRAGDRVDAEPRAIRDANGELVGIARRSCDPGVKSNLESSGDKND